MTNAHMTLRPHGTVVAQILGPTDRRPLLVSEVDRHGTLVTAAEWDDTGALRAAQVRIPDGRWIGIEPGALELPIWGRSDRLWRLDPDPPFHRVEPITLFQAVDYGAIGFIPPLAEPAQLPPGAGTAVLNFLAQLLVDQGTRQVSYRGPYATEQLFTALLESFCYDPAATAPLEQFLLDDLSWMPAPHERVFPAAGIYVQLRDGVEKVVFQGRPYYRRRWQNVIRDEPRIVRQEGEGYVCSLWALGEPIEDHLILDRGGELVAVRPVARAEGSRVPFSDRWRSVVGELIARSSTPLLRPSILDVIEHLRLEWGPVTGDLLETSGESVMVSLRLPHVARGKLDGLDKLDERIRVALSLAAEVAKLLGPTVREKAQAALATLPEPAQQAALELARVTSEAAMSTVPSGLDQLVQALLSGTDLPS